MDSDLLDANELDDQLSKYLRDNNSRSDLTYRETPLQTPCFNPISPKMRLMKFGERKESDSVVHKRRHGGLFKGMMATSRQPQESFGRLHTRDSKEILPPVSRNQMNVTELRLPGPDVDLSKPVFRTGKSSLVRESSTNVNN